ncbi:activated Cdc42 kinase-like isoform X2 [Chelonus insularis]|uniref:activated Cdc42 kinase-like isoform X2 n=1 Tax=Chelonus insularis TaxID=460826 RepID=UPI00158E3C35|nr:activated Cdc42 kinase-like isoform X2 [Chelonus insularis]
MDIPKKESTELGLYDFLVEAELQQYYETIRDDFKVEATAQLKRITENDLKAIGMSKPQMCRLKKYYRKYFHKNSLSMSKKVLLSKQDGKHCGSIDHTFDGNYDKLISKMSNKYIISTDSIVIHKKLGAGEFSIVQQGIWNNNGKRIQVAIKCLSRKNMQSNPIEFLKEASIMYSINHDHIVKLYGVALDTYTCMLITELAPLRSLLECLKEPSARVNFSITTLCNFATQIASGMHYLETKRLIHRDLAARNILVFSKNKIKISDFGFSRALSVEKDYYRTQYNVNLKLPIAWCAPESILYLKFTSSSDVWAFGVTLWEMFSYGSQPWAGLTGHEILDAINEPRFQRLEQPDYCPRDYYLLMQKCWQHEPIKRPQFSELVKLLPDMQPEQVRTLQKSDDVKQLIYRQNDIICVLDKTTDSHLWKGVLNDGRIGFFNPAHTTAHLNFNKDKNINEHIENNNKDINARSRQKIQIDLISSPQNDSNSNEEDRNNFDFYKHGLSMGLDHHDMRELLGNNQLSDFVASSIVEENINNQHEYYEIKEEGCNKSLITPTGSNKNDPGTSLTNDIDTIFQSFGAPFLFSPENGTSAEHESSNVQNEIREMQTKSSVNKKQTSVKPISAADQKTLYSAIAMAQELTARSMTDLERSQELAQVLSNTSRHRKFSMKLTNQNSPKHNRRHFSEEAASIPDIQATLSDEAKAVYNSLVAVQVFNSSLQTDDSKMSKYNFPDELQTMSNKNLDMSIVSPHLEEIMGFNKNGNQSNSCLLNLSSKINDSWFSLSPSMTSYTLKKSHSMSNIEAKENAQQTETNPIPLPPRDRSKSLHSQLLLPRHKRKYPLIIPETTENSAQTMEQRGKGDFPALQESDDNSICSSDVRLKTPVYALRVYNRLDNLEQPAIIESETSSSKDTTSTSDDLKSRAENFIKSTDILPVNNVKVKNVEHSDHDNEIDTKLKYLSLNFKNGNDSSNNENFSKSTDLKSFNFELLNNFYDKYSQNQNNSFNSDLKLTVNDMKSTIPTSSSSNHNYCLDSVKQTDQSVCVPELFRQSDHVSCEDLLEFAYDKPNIHRTRGPHNGSQSDEVRIMLKVLHGQSTPESCVLALNAASWDVLTAIKLERLRSLLQIQSTSTTLKNCQKILSRYGGNVVEAATFLKSENCNVLNDNNVE